MGLVKFVKSITRSAYNALTSKDPDTLYFPSDENTVILGDRVVGEKNTVTSVAGKTGAVTLAKSDVGLGNVDNVSNATLLATLSYTDSGSSSTKYVSKVTQTNGVINVEHTTLPAQVNYTVAITEQEGGSSDAYSKRYTITQNGTGLSKNIDIAKDMVVSSGTVETKTTSGTWGEPGTYLVLTLANATSDKVYINVGNLIEYVTSGSSASDMVVIAVSNDHKVTATLTDGKITKAKLASAVQASLGLADSSVQTVAVASGTNNGTIKLTVNGTPTDNIAVKGLGSAAYTASTAYATSAQGTKADNAISSLTWA